MKIKGRIISLLTAAAMIMAMAPQITVFADTTTETYGGITITTDDGNFSYDSNNNVITIESGGTYTIKGESSTETTVTIKITASDSKAVTITLENVDISSSTKSPLEIDTTSNVTIKLSGTNTLDASGAKYKAGLQKTSTGNTLTITGDGSLTAKGGTNAAGIGGGNGKDGSSITISGGTIEATGGTDAAGIGGGYGGNGSNITISSGTVTANGSYGAAGIGGGCAMQQAGNYIGGNGNYIKIIGGTVTATSEGNYNGGAGIGCGYGGSANDITIGGGTVTATGGPNSAGIGGGSWCSADKITISGGTVNATGNSDGAGIGGGCQQIVTNIEISGGYITATSNNGSNIGSGYNASGTSTVTITGGYFADSNATIGESGTGKVYSCDVKSGYAVYANVEDTKDEYHARVLSASSTFTVTYSLPSGVTGTAPTDNNTYKYGTPVSVSESKPYTKDGYVQVGWVLSEDDDEALTSFDIYDNTTLYPLFKRQFTKSDEDTSITLTYGEQITDIDLENYLKFVDNSTFSSTDGEFSFALATGSELPAGLELNNGVISGTPTVVMEATEVKFTVTDETPYYVMTASLDPDPATVSATLTLTFTVNKATPTVTAPTANDLTYTGSAQALVTAGTTTGGEMQYALSETGDYSAEIPTGTDAGEYTVYYKVVGDDNYNDYTPADNSVSVTISKTTPTVTAPTANTLTYNGSAQELVTAGSTTGGEMQYSTDNSTWSADIPTKTDVGTYTVYYKVVGNDNYEDADGSSVTVTISKATPTVTAPTANTLTYTGSAQELVTAGSTTGGEMQ
ncbi:MAG: carbohydrate-binding domain-containing protein, partial [Clostridiales bacterium]|nr:carbohydrate-binding domain-containing protein [Clostridiales bacterium]